MKTSLLPISGGLCLTIALAAGCGSADSAADREGMARAATASVVQATDAATISVADLQQFPTKATWSATIGDKTFACTSDERFALPDCQPLE